MNPWSWLKFSAVLIIAHCPISHVYTLVEGKKEIDGQLYGTLYKYWEKLYPVFFVLGLCDYLVVCDLCQKVTSLLLVMRGEHVTASTRGEVIHLVGDLSYIERFHENQGCLSLKIPNRWDYFWPIMVIGFYRQACVFAIVASSLPTCMILVQVKILAQASWMLAQVKVCEVRGC